MHMNGKVTGAGDYWVLIVPRRQGREIPAGVGCCHSFKRTLPATLHISLDLPPLGAYGELVKRKGGPGLEGWDLA